MEYNLSDIRLAMKKDNQAFEKLYKSIYSDLYKFSLYILGNTELAKDAVSETVVDVYTGISKLKDETRFEQWIMRILSIKCKHKIKDKYNKLTVYNPSVSNIDDLEIEDENRDKTWERTDLQMALLKISGRERVIVGLCVIQGYTSKEVGEMLNMNPATVRSKLNRALMKMRNYLEA